MTVHHSCDWVAPPLAVQQEAYDESDTALEDEAFADPAQAGS
jgi:hypothetical protein